jgi:glycosyltransferase involved in cell wall biosynthesis
MEISAIICTHNHSRYLIKAIRSLLDQSLHKSLYEIIVVDNCSIDDTKKVVLGACAKINNLEYVYEPVLGLSQARNTGWKKAKGKYVAFLDDDAIANRYWLEKILLTFNTLNPSPGVVGGKVVPLWESRRPDWISDNLLGFYTVVDWSDSAIILDDKQWLAGANISFPKHILKSLGGFKTELGRKGKKLLSNEEILIQKKIEKIGCKIYYSPDIVVQHHIPCSRVTKKWLIRRIYWQGISNSVLLVNWNNFTPFKRFTRAIAIARKLIILPHHLVRLILPTNDPKCFKLQCEYIGRLGNIMGLLGLY